MQKEVWKAVWTLLSISIGAGILALPYVVEKAGFLTGVLVIVLIGILMIFFNLYLGEILLRTRIRHQISGLAGIYLGKYGKHFMMFFNTLSIYGALAAYVIGAGAALHAIFGYNETLFSLIFFIVFSIVIYFGINIFSKAEFILNPIKILLLVILFFILFNKVNFSNLYNFDIIKILIPYGVAVFAFTSISALPEMNIELKNKNNFKKAIIIGGILTILFYLIFVFSVVGSVDNNVNEVATVSLNLLGKNIGIFANLFALLSLTTAFVGLGFALKDNYKLDYKINNLFSWLLTIIIPILFFFLNLGDFIFFLEVSGAISIGAILFLILLIHGNARKLGDRKPEYEMSGNFIFKSVLFLLILIGIIYVLNGYF